MEIKDTEPALILGSLQEIFTAQQLAATNFEEEMPRYISLGAYVEGDLAGGILVELKYQTAHVTQLAVKPIYQGQKIGTRLLQAGEKQVQAANAKSMTLTTRSYQAPEFYQKQGYTCFGQLVDVPMAGVTKYFFIKRFA